MTVKVTRAALAELSPGDAAALWKIKRDSGAPYDLHLFERWRDESAANAAAWDSLNHAWSLFDDADDPVFAALRQDALAAGPARSTHRRNGLLALAACLVLALAGTLAFVRADGDGRGGRSATLAHNDGGPAEQSYFARDASQRIELADGTEMVLAKGARARTAFADGTRRVLLDEGRARFSVRHDREHRFEVVVGAWSIVDYGTRFDVEVQKDGLRVALFEGSVEVTGNGNPPTRLQPGKQLIAQAGASDRISDIGAADGSQDADGMAQFENATLGEAVQRFNAVNEVQLVIADRRATNLRITGLFRLRDPARFSALLSQLLPVRVSRVDAEKIEIRSLR